jgi:hypothetical protein
LQSLEAARMAAHGLHRAGMVGQHDLARADLGTRQAGMRADQELSRADLLGRQGLAQAGLASGHEFERAGLVDSVNRFNAQLRAAQRGARAEGFGFLRGERERARGRAGEAALGTPLPASGLDPASIGDIHVADLNMRREIAQQDRAIAAGQASAKSGQQSELLGAGLGVLGAAAPAIISAI